MEYNIVVVKNKLGCFTVSKNETHFKVLGTGMFGPRFFPREAEATEYARDQLLIITLENELLISE